MTTIPALQEKLKGTLSGKERPLAKVRKVGVTNSVKINICKNQSMVSQNKIM